MDKYFINYIDSHWLKEEFISYKIKEPYQVVDGLVIINFFSIIPPNHPYHYYLSDKEIDKKDLHIYEELADDANFIDFKILERRMKISELID